MLKHIYPDGKAFAAHLESIDDERLLALCCQLVLKCFRVNGIDPEPYADLLQAMRHSRAVTTEELGRQIEELDDNYDARTDDDEESEQMDDAVESIHRKARALSALLYGLRVQSDRLNAHACIYEAMHSHVNCGLFYLEIGAMFGFSAAHLELPTSGTSLRA